MRQGLFITGTDTGAGKTTVTSILAAGMRERGIYVGVMKPAETGCSIENGVLQPEDALTLRRISQSPASLDLICPYRYSEPLAPALAAAREGPPIELDHIRACYDRLAASHDLLLVEGAGGLLVPLTPRDTMLDLAVALDLPLLVVARNVLGVINHTALTVAAAISRGVEVVGVVLNDVTEIQDAATATNRESLERWAGASLLGHTPYIPNPSDEILASLAGSLPLDDIVDDDSLPRGPNPR